MSEPWYKDGLNFKCTGCGQCCTGAPGYVWVTEEEIAAIAKSLNMSIPQFKKTHTHQIDGRTSLVEDPKNYDCVFLKERKCQIYNLRPKQCRTFPWWQENVENRAAWKETAARCEGVNHPDSVLVPLGEIKKNLDS